MLILVDDFSTSSTKAAPRLIRDLANEFSTMGYTVTICYPDSDASLPIDKIEDEEFYRLAVPYGELKTPFKPLRLLRESMLSHSIWSKCKCIFADEHYDLVVYYSPSIFFGALVGKLKQLMGCKSFLVLRDIFPQWAIDTGQLRNYPGLTGYFRRIEALNYRVADRIGVQSPNNLSYFEDDVENREKLEVIYNWAKPRHFEESSLDISALLGRNDVTILFYGGNIGVAQDVESLLNLAIELENDKVVLFFVGEGEKTSLIREHIDRKLSSNVILHPSVPQDDYFQLLRQADIGLIALDANHQTQNIPGKLLGYLECRKPIFGFVNQGNDLIEIVNGGRAGKVVESMGVFELAADVRRVSLSPDELVEMGRNSGKLLQEIFSVRAAAESILGVLE